MNDKIKSKTNIVVKRDKEQVIKELFKLLEDVKKSFDAISKSSKSGDIKHLVTVFANDKRIKKEVDHINDRILSLFLHSPFGKDLRRSIAYVHIVKAIAKIQNAASNISEFLNTAYKENIKKNWVKEISEKIITRLDDLVTLIGNEDLELSYKIYKGDESINKTYQKFLDEIEKNIKDLASLKNKKPLLEDKELAIGFILALKNFEIAGDEIKEIAEMIKFIVTGKYII